ncbi:DUF962 domain-containing protein [Roseomonas stagni]|uniref:DUF962 domain-containing protein n=1 Tax=Falsiroseomonas algicola TaxID=2716930 RepID=A0A6M1LHF8_9PROT|nr:DUF962 domain-containing protein [Falsiroseomonas algicola]NGM19805.1 DUF962 domain-containing protein [Falsiroseomonas algicola]
METPRIETYAEFWPHYLRQHARPATRAWHAVGTFTGLGLLGLAIVTARPWLALLAVLVGYGCAWLSHWLVERNRPATFGHPLWSLASDFRMAWLLVTGRLQREIEAASLQDKN